MYCFLIIRTAFYGRTIIFYSTVIGSHAFRSVAPEIWNSLSVEVRSAATQFARNLKRIFSPVFRRRQHESDSLFYNDIMRIINFLINE